MGKIDFRSMLLENKRLCFGLVFITIAAICIALFPPLILKSIVDQITQGKAVSIKIALFYFLVLALANIVDSVKEILITKTGQLVTRTIRQAMCEKLDRLSAGYFVGHETGKVVSLFISDVNTIQDLFSDGIISMVVNALQIISIFVMMFIMSKGLGLIMLVVVPVLFLFTRYCQKAMQKAQYYNRIVIAKVTNHIPETIRSLRTIQTMRKQAFMEDKYYGYLKESYHSMEKANFYDSIYSPVVLILNAVVIAFVMYLSSLTGEIRIFFGISAGSAVAIIAYVNAVFAPIENLGMEIQNIQSALSGIRRIRSFMHEPEEPQKSLELSEEEMNISNQAVSFQNVDFGYMPEKKVLNQVSFHILAGEQVVLTGRTGCGKTTSLQLILGLYKPQSGSVLIYGKPAYELTKECKKKLFGYVEQKFHPVQGTVAEQITLGDKNISLEQVKNAVRLVGLETVIDGFTNGYEEKCTEKLFSQGQFQLLSIARAVVRNPRIILLDEITANLDANTEQMILHALKKVGKNRTVISISHRMQMEGRMEVIDRK